MRIEKERLHSAYCNSWTWTDLAYSHNTELEYLKLLISLTVVVLLEFDYEYECGSLYIPNLFNPQNQFKLN